MLAQLIAELGWEDCAPHLQMAWLREEKRLVAQVEVEEGRVFQLEADLEATAEER